MLNVHIMMEDTVIVAEYKETNGVNMWVGSCVNLHYGKSHDFKMNGEQFAAILNLGLHDVDGNALYGYDMTQLYKVAEEAIQDWPPECCPFP